MKYYIGNENEYLGLIHSCSGSTENKVSNKDLWVYFRDYYGGTSAYLSEYKIWSGTCLTPQEVESNYYLT